jgi:filamentous hemagglutinin
VVLTNSTAGLGSGTYFPPDGSKTTALVPQVYAAARSGDLCADGKHLCGSIMGDNVQINSSGNITNSGSIAGRQIVSLSAQNINNLNQIAGNTVTVC